MPNEGVVGDDISIADQQWKDNTHTALQSVESEEDKDDLAPDIDKVD